MDIARISAKGQMTLPKRLRRRLGIGAGDTVIFELDRDRLFLRKLNGASDEYLRGTETTLTEWSSTEDERAWHDL